MVSLQTSEDAVALNAEYSHHLACDKQAKVYDNG